MPLSKSVFLEEMSLGAITDIAPASQHVRSEYAMVIAGSHGAAFYDSDLKRTKLVSFAGRATHVDLVDVDGDGTLEFLNRGGQGWQDACLFDAAGLKVWTYGGGVDDVVAGDLDGDGTLEFVVGFNGDRGVELLNSHGVRQWRQPDGNVWHVEIVDVGGDGAMKIVHSNAGGHITVRDASGQILSERRPPTSVYLSDSDCETLY